MSTVHTQQWLAEDKERWSAERDVSPLYRQILGLAAQYARDMERLDQLLEKRHIEAHSAQR